ncbi:hypothetical protein [Micromonospora sp. NPDC007230]|uniref:hypothetical protein n=1 Tax=Micromonospora sp. NPDC007230 TaxID=3364237 RepID=UPI0036C3CA19
MLMDLAARARQQPAPPGIGPYHYMHQRGWYLGVAANTEGRILRSGITEIEREQWIAADGSGRLKRDDGVSIASDQEFGPGGLYAGFVSSTATPESLRTALNANTSAGFLRAVADLWGRQVVPPNMQGDLLELLASQPGVTAMGQTTDRVGRPGVAIGADKTDGVAEKIVLVFSPDTGALLDAESIVLEKSDLPVQVPATTAYTVWLDRGQTGSTEVRP